MAGTLGEYARNEAIVCIGLTEKAGRGLTVTRDVPASYLIHSVDPVVAHPSLKMLQRVRLIRGGDNVFLVNKL